MAKSLSRICAALITACVLFSSGSALADARYGFAAKCRLWSELLPVSFQHDPKDNEPHTYNVIWINGEGISGLDADYSLFQLNNGVSNFPANVGSGRDTPQCTKTYNGCAYEDWGSVGKGISGYDSLKSEFPSETVKVASGSLPQYDGSLQWIYIPVRKLKVLRIELFTPWVSGATHAASKSYNQPLYFEYRATGNGSELKLKSWGSTSDITSAVGLPDVFNPVDVVGIQAWTDEHNNHDWSGLDPGAGVVYLTEEQKKSVPGSCR